MTGDLKHKQPTSRIINCIVLFPVPRFLFSSRFGMAVLGFLGFFTMSSQKMSLQIALVCMVNETAAAILDGDPLPVQSVPNDVIFIRGNTSTEMTPALIETEACGVAAEVFKSYVKVDWIEDVSEVLTYTTFLILL